ncbi:hypothetical protein SASPL_100893 [Salvia splendens]|uniref:Uncharacterized protein n=1 Tax=Salvia splendens TaxID=180675 RepID=A0A8X8YT04_SALSN|nr:hypothetical protein SASPL_100893 [Salvia splendens]
MAPSTDQLSRIHHPPSLTSEIHEIYEFEDELDLDVEHRYKLLTTFKLPSHGLIQGSANGLLLVMPPEGLSLCNPITREYMEIRTPQDSNYKHPQKFTFGFGVSTRTRQYKVVMFSHDPEKDKRLGFLQSECHVWNEDEIVVWLMEEYGDESGGEKRGYQEGDCFGDENVGSSW